MNSEKFKRIKWEIDAFNWLKGCGGPLEMMDGRFFFETRSKKEFGMSKGDHVGIISLACPTNPTIEAIGVLEKVVEGYDEMKGMTRNCTIRIIDSCVKKFNVRGDKLVSIPVEKRILSAKVRRHMRETGLSESDDNEVFPSAMVVKRRAGSKFSVKTQSTIGRYFKKKV